MTENGGRDEEGKTRGQGGREEGRERKRERDREEREEGKGRERRRRKGKRGGWGKRHNTQSLLPFRLLFRLVGMEIGTGYDAR